MAIVRRARTLPICRRHGSVRRHQLRRGTSSVNATPGYQSKALDFRIRPATAVDDPGASPSFAPKSLTSLFQKGASAPIERRGRETTLYGDAAMKDFLVVPRKRAVGLVRAPDDTKKLTSRRASLAKESSDDLTIVMTFSLLGLALSLLAIGRLGFIDAGSLADLLVLF